MRNINTKKTLLLVLRMACIVW